MTGIFRKQVHNCGRGKRFIYRLPRATDEQLALSLRSLGDLKSLSHAGSTLWFMKSDLGFKACFETGTNELDVRFRPKGNRESVETLERFLSSFYNAEISEEL